jgi:fatty acid desaturase
MESSEIELRTHNLELSPGDDNRHRSGREPIGMSPAAEYAELRRLLERKGLFARQPLYYIGTVSMALVALAAGLTTLTTVKVFGLQLLNAVYLAFVFSQLSYIVHDAGHGQIFSSPRRNHVLGTLVANMVLGMSYGYWRRSHNRHHANPNQEDFDPDIDVSLMAFTEEQARGKRGLGRIITMYQAYLFVPMLFFDSFRRRIESIQFLLHEKSKTEISLLVAHYALVGAFLFPVLETWKALLFLFVQQATYGMFVASAFAPNHKGMPILPKDTQMDLLPRQVVTTRNVRSNPFTDFWSGALNYQIEHHLFPNMPRNKLKESRLIVRAFCAARGVPYTETSALESYRQTFSYLHRVGAPLRKGVFDATRSG